LELIITLEEETNRAVLFGPSDRFLRMVRDALGIRITARDSSVYLSGDSAVVGRAAEIIQQMQERVRTRGPLNDQEVADLVLKAGRQEDVSLSDRIDVFTRDFQVAPRTAGQRVYVEAIAKHDLVFCLGPAGTGKTYLAVAMAAHMLKQGIIKRIVLVRPAVEAGEKLGYLPGDLQAKVNPYLRPLLDAMHDMMGFDQLRRFMANDVIEVIPLAFMRGRTLNSAAIILDEAQNATVSQMLMFLTRLGHHSKMIVTGDDSQVDLEKPEQSGLVDAVHRLGDVEGIAVVRLTDADIVRHRLVQNIVNAYGRNGETAHAMRYGRRRTESVVEETAGRAGSPRESAGEKAVTNG
jgi:phosphate starvation-inducible protein PhoH and related proteins